MNWNAEIGIPLAIAGAIVLVLVWLFGRPGRRAQTGRRQTRGEGSRREPGFADRDGLAASEDYADDDMRADAPERMLQSDLQLPMDDDHSSFGNGADDDFSRTRAAAQGSARGDTGQGGRRGERSALDFEKIVTLFVAARSGHVFRGTDIIVAAEKTGLEFGDMRIFHRLVDGHPESGPVFSVANLAKPGSFDPAHLRDLTTPGLTLFMTLPGPVSALDAWDAMLPTAQRLAELLDGLVLDEERSALGRQRIAHIRDELRALDRERERHARRPKPRW